MLFELFRKMLLLSLPDLLPTLSSSQLYHYKLKLHISAAVKARINLLLSEPLLAKVLE